MFNKENRYITKSIAKLIPIEVSLFLWSLIDDLNIEKDYLQIFELNPIGEGIVEIVHKQEVPEYECRLYICNEHIVDKFKIYAINSIEYSTLIFSYEY